MAHAIRRKGPQDEWRGSPRESHRYVVRRPFDHGVSVLGFARRSRRFHPFIMVAESPFRRAALLCGCTVQRSAYRGPLLAADEVFPSLAAIPYILDSDCLRCAGSG